MKAFVYMFSILVSVIVWPALWAFSLSTGAPWHAQLIAVAMALCSVLIFIDTLVAMVRSDGGPG